VCDEFKLAIEDNFDDVSFKEEKGRLSMYLIDCFIHNIVYNI